MKAFYLLILLSLIGFGINIADVYLGDKPSNGTGRAIPKIELPFDAFIAATGIVEPASKKIIIGANVSGLVTQVYVNDGDKVKKGDALFCLDDTLLKHKIAMLKAQREAALAKIQAAQDQFQLLQEFKKVSPKMVTSQKFTTSKDTLKITQASLQALDQKIEISQKELAFYTIQAPIDGIVLRSDLTKGAYFNKNSINPLLILGSQKYTIKVSINEYDIVKFRPDTPAVAFVRGHPTLKTSLQYLYTIPYVKPKTSLTGSATERTDTRVLQVVYAIEANEKFPLYVGEQLDVFIKTDK